ncbi:MAG: hypothetical protein ACK5PS_08495 [Desulfopila sp.]
MTVPEKRLSTDGQKARFGRIGPRSGTMLWFSIIVRGAHQFGGALFLVYYFLGQGDALPVGYLALAGASGLLLVWTEWLRHRQLYREVAGVVTGLKCLVLGAVIHGWLPQAIPVACVFLLASVAAHAPREVRHRLLW